MANTRERLLELQTRLQDNGVQLAAIGPTANMRYLLDYVPHPDERLCLLLVTDKIVRMVAPAVNLEAIAAHTDVELYPWADSDGPEGALRRAVSGLSTGSIAVDGAMRADFLLRIQNACNPGLVKPVEQVLAPLRVRKSREEIDSLARAAAQADQAMMAGIHACRLGATEADVSWAVEASFRQDGAETVDFTLIASGPNGAYPHHHSGERRLARGDAIILDIGATLDGYKSDITRVVHMGRPSEEFIKAYSAVLSANQAAMTAVRPGVKASEIDRAARSSLESSGYGKYFVHRTGHGIGLEGHEPPWIMEGDETVLQEGMTFSIEPGVYLVGQFGVRIEDIVVVTESGVRNLTGCDHVLVIND